MVLIINFIFSRFISDIEAVCRQWIADGPKNLLVRLHLSEKLTICISSPFISVSLLYIMSDASFLFFFW